MQKVISVFIGGYFFLIVCGFVVSCKDYLTYPTSPDPTLPSGNCTTKPAKEKVFKGLMCPLSHPWTRGVPKLSLSDPEILCAVVDVQC